MNYAIAGDGWSILVRVPWVKQNPAEHLTQVMLQMQRLGAFTWAKPDGIRRAAAATPFDFTDEVIKYQISLRTFAMLGLPPLAGSMVAYEDKKLLIALRAPGVTEKDTGTESMLGPDESGVVTRALEQFTGLKAEKYVSGEALVVRQGIVEIAISDAQAAKIFGKKGWEGWKKNRAAKAVEAKKAGTPDAAPIDTPTETGAELSFAEKVRIERWMKDNLGVADSTMAVHVDRTLLNVIDEIEADPDLKPHIKQLLQKDMQGVGTPAHTFALQDLLEQARYEKQRKRLGVAVPSTPDKVEQAFEYDIGVKIAAKGDVIADREKRLALVWDWDLFKTGKNENQIDKFAKRHWHMEVDWAVERTDNAAAKPFKRRTAHDASEVSIGHTFRLEQGEKQGLFVVHAFIRSSHFAPMHISTPVLVKTESTHMEELRSKAMGDMMADDTKQTVEDFNLGSITQDVLGGSGDTRGSKFTGNTKAGFKVADPAQRAKDRLDEMALNKKMLEYLKLQQTNGRYGYGEAIAAAEEHQKNLEEADKKIKGDEAAGWKPFELRGTYLSRNGQVPSGGLTLYGFVKAGDVITGGPSIADIKTQTGFHVKIRDLSNKVESDLEFEANGVDFHAALREAFLKLCKTYPEGKMTVLAEDQVFGAKSVPKPNGKTVGFELATTSAWKRVEAKVFDPVVQVLSNAAAMAIMMIFPPSAAVIMPVLAMTSIAQTVDDLYTKYDKGKLKNSDVGIGLVKIGLDVLPAARGAKFLNPAKTTIQELKGGLNLRLVAFDAVRFGSEVLVMREEARNQIAEIQEKQILVMAEKYKAMLDLENENMNASDPRLAQMRAEIEADASAIRDTVSTTWTNLISNRAAFLVGPHFLGTDHTSAARDPNDPVYHGREKAPRDGDDAHVRDDASSQTRGRSDDPHSTAKGARKQAPDVEPDRTIDLETVVLAGQDAELRRAAAAVPPKPGYLDVMVHGSVDDFMVLHNGVKVHIDHRSLAAYIKKTGQKFDRIRLLACDAGKHPKGVAQHLANKLGVDVIAPSDKLFIHLNEDGSFHSMTIGPHPTRDTGEWVPFKAKKSETRWSKPKDTNEKRAREPVPDTEQTTKPARDESEASSTVRVGDEDGTSGRAAAAAARKEYEAEFAKHKENVANEANGPVNDARMKVDAGLRWKEAEDAGEYAYKDTFRNEYLKLREAGVDHPKAMKGARSAARKSAVSAVNTVAKEVAEQRARDAIKKDTNSDGVPDAFKETGAGMKQDLADYEAGTRGKVAREVAGELPNKTVSEMEAVLTSKGGKRSPATGTETVREGEIEYPQIVYTFPDGTLVRLKPDGDTRNSTKPMYSVEMFVGTPNPSAKNPQDNVAFKVDTAGNPVPKGGEAIQNPFKHPDQRAAFQDEILRRGHHLAKE